MTDSFRLGRIAGVDVGVNWSVLAIFGLIWFGLAADQFPRTHPGHSGVAYALAGLVAALVFFGSLLAHEVAHAVVAIRNGLEVDGITLWLFGGVARLGGEAADPGADLRIAGVGPLVSIVLAAVFGALLLVLGGPGASLVAGAVAWLAGINLALAAFNLVPAAPLDGGRILRAYLWRRRGDRLSATVTAARAGRAFGYLLIALGVGDFLFGIGYGGLWFALIGWFLVNAARAEEQHAALSRELGGVRVRDVMTPDPTVAPDHLSVDQFVDTYVFGHRHSTFPLVDADGDLAGLVTLGRAKSVPAEERGMVSVRRIACPLDEVAIADPDEALIELLPRMRSSADGRAVVVDDGRVVGIVSPSDVTRALEFGGDSRPAPSPFGF